MNPKLIMGVKVSERTQKQRQDKSCNNQLLRSVIIIKVYLEKMTLYYIVSIRVKNLFFRSSRVASTTAGIHQHFSFSTYKFLTNSSFINLSQKFY